MKRKLTIPLILGKDTKIIYSTLTQLEKNEILKFILPAANAEPEPPMSTELTLRKGDVFMFVDDFNNLTQEYEDFFPIPVIIFLLGGSPRVMTFEIKEPSSLSLFSIFFDIDDYDVEYFLPILNDELIYITSNFGFLKVKETEEEDFYESEVFATIRMLCGTLKSYHSIVRRTKRKYYSKFLLNKRKNRLYKKRINRKRRDYLQFLWRLEIIRKKYKFFKKKFSPFNSFLDYVMGFDDFLEYLAENEVDLSEFLFEEKPLFFEILDLTDWANEFFFFIDDVNIDDTFYFFAKLNEFYYLIFNLYGNANGYGDADFDKIYDAIFMLKHNSFQMYEYIINED